MSLRTQGNLALVEPEVTLRIKDEPVAGATPGTGCEVEVEGVWLEAEVMGSCRRCGVVNVELADGKWVTVRVERWRAGSEGR